MASDVALIRGDDRANNIRRSLELIENQIHFGKRIIIKLNMTSLTRPLSATHAEALKAVLQFIKDRTDNHVTVAEGCATGDAMKGFNIYGMTEVAQRYGVKLVDLNCDKWVEVEVLDRDLRPKTLRFARTVAESDCRISLSPMKTHDVVVVTLSLKNLVMGSLLCERRVHLERITHHLSHLLRSGNALFPREFDWLVRHVLRSDKVAMHQTYPVMNYNLYLIAKAFPVHLSVLDGFTAMEGRGPTRGTAVNLRLAIASTDFIAADSIGALAMGFNPAQIGYLYHAMSNGLGEGSPEKIRVLGERLQDCIRPFKPHPWYAKQLSWRFSKVELMRVSRVPL